MYVEFCSEDDLPAAVSPALLDRVSYIFGGLEDDINIAHIYHREETQLQAAILRSVGLVMSMCCLLMYMLNPARFVYGFFVVVVMYSIHLPSLTYTYSFTHSYTLWCDPCVSDPFFVQRKISFDGQRNEKLTLFI